MLERIITQELDEYRAKKAHEPKVLVLSEYAYIELVQSVRLLVGGNVGDLYEYMGMEVVVIPNNENEVFVAFGDKARDRTKRERYSLRYTID
jgi:hypothetical protein